MLHPFFCNKKFTNLFLSLTGILIINQIVGLHFGFNIEWYPAIVDSVVYNLVLQALGLGLWFGVKYHSTENRTTRSWIYYPIGIYFYMMIWMGISYIICIILIPDNNDYHEFSLNAIPIRVIFGLLIFTVMLLIYSLLKYQQSLQEKSENEARLHQLVNEAELSSLKSQINPHFLFNSLNSISALTITDADKAREMLNKLSEFMRYSLRKQDVNLLALKEEIENMNKYLEIEKTRFGERLIFENEIDLNCFDAKIPAMILQPLYENAVKHGVYESIEPVTIRTFARMINNTLEISIINEFDPDTIPRKGTELGLKNIAGRLQLIYNESNLLRTSIENNYFEACLLIPQQNN